MQSAHLAMIKAYVMPIIQADLAVFCDRLFKILNKFCNLMAKPVARRWGCGHST
ncbi:MAG: hypothetical protein ACI9PY_002049 [Ascidiaceihabitans sp.]|jgi:hypothetical protein